MSLKQVYQSMPVNYDLTPSTPQHASDSLLAHPEFWFVAHPEMRDPPRIYDESLGGGVIPYGIKGVFHRPSPLASEGSLAYVISVWMVTKNYWDTSIGGGQGWWLQDFDSTTGLYLGREWVGNGLVNPLPVGWPICQQDRSVMWALNTGSTQFWRLDTATFGFQDGPYDSSKFADPGYTGSLIDGFFINAPQNVMVAHILNNSSLYQSHAGIFDWTTGELLHQVPTAGTCYKICPAENNQCYCIGTTGIVTLVDYMRGISLGVFSLPGAGQTFLTNGVGWDFNNKRILICDGTVPDDANGTPHVCVKGYFPIPKPIRLTPPITLGIPRKNSAIRVTSRAYGNCGEHITSVTGTWTSASPSDATVSPAQTLSDGNGYLSTFLTGIHATDVEVTITAEV